VYAAFAAARETGRALTILNAAPARTLDPALLAVTDLLVVNEIEAATLAGYRPDGAGRDAALAHCAKLLELAPGVALTLGEQGVCYASRDGARYQIPAAAARSVDSTAAGDTFAGVLAACLAAGRPGEGALLYACAAAALTVERPGAIASIPRAAEIAARHRAAYAYSGGGSTESSTEQENRR
jgi:ribokinase